MTFFSASRRAPNTSSSATAIAPAALPAADDGDAADLPEVDRFLAEMQHVAVDVDVFANEPVRLHGRDARPPDSFGVGAQL